MSVATHIAPNDLLDAPSEVFWAIAEVLQRQAEEADRERRRGR
jgi:hypothetical protein